MDLAILGRDLLDAHLVTDLFRHGLRLGLRGQDGASERLFEYACDVGRRGALPYRWWFGILLGAHDFDAYKAFVAFHPGVVAGWNCIGRALRESFLGPVIQSDGDGSGHDVADMRHLTAVRLDDRLHTFGPFPSWLHVEPPEGEAGKPHHFDTCLVGCPNFIRVVVGLGFKFRDVHSTIGHDILPILDAEPDAAIVGTAAGFIPLFISFS